MFAKADWKACDNIKKLKIAKILFIVPSYVLHTEHVL